MQAISGEELTLDRKARMKLPFEEIEARPATVRILDFDPTFKPLTPEEAQRAAARCIHCPDPSACYKACPLHNDIPSAMWLIEKVTSLGQPRSTDARVRCPKSAEGYAHTKRCVRAHAHGANAMNPSCPVRWKPL